jgi:imidazole glycerol-phosphate synthase subunit HisH
MKNIGIIDYGSGNLRSVSKALDAVGAHSRLVSTHNALDEIDAVVVPGVGAFGDCARHLRATGLWEPLREWIAQDRPYLGICLGYQLLFESSEESPGVEGLRVLPGVVRRFSTTTLKVPHMGWNTLDIRQPDDRLYAGLDATPSLYFVHSYFPAPDDDSLVTATCDYAGNFAASVSRGALSAVQFHPEKSQRNGLAILRNFVMATQNPKPSEARQPSTSSDQNPRQSKIQNPNASPASH